MKKILAILLIAVSIFSIGNTYNLNKYKKNLKLLEQKIDTNKVATIKVLEKNIIIQYESESTYPNKNTVLVNGNGAKDSFCNIINKKVLIIRVAKSDCSLCLETQLSTILGLLKEKNMLHKIYIFSNVRNYREFLSFINYNKIPPEESYFLEDPKSFSIPVDNYNPFLYLFCTDPSLEIKYLFVPISSQKQLTNDYLNLINKLLN